MSKHSTELQLFPTLLTTTHFSLGLFPDPLPALLVPMYLTALASLTFWGSQHNPSFTFLASCNVLSRPLCSDSPLFLTLKAEPDGRRCQALQLPGAGTWFPSWIIFAWAFFCCLGLRNSSSMLPSQGAGLLGWGLALFIPFSTGLSFEVLIILSIGRGSNITLPGGPLLLKLHFLYFFFLHCLLLLIVGLYTNGHL